LTPPNTAPDGNLTPGRGVFGVAFDARGHTLAASTGDGRVDVIDPTTWRVRRSIRLVNDAISSTATLAISPDGNTLALAGPRVVELADIYGTHRRQVNVGPFDTAGIALQPHGQLLAVGVGDSRVLLIDPRTAHVQSTLLSHHGGIYALAFDSTGTTLALGASDGTVTLWALSDRQPVGPPLTSSIASSEAGIAGVAFSPDDNSLYAASFDLSVLRYDLRTAEQIHRLCAVIGRNLTPDEQHTYLGSSTARRQICPNWPASP
jgi:WD40 repeat protein